MRVRSDPELLGYNKNNWFPTSQGPSGTLGTWAYQLVGNSTLKYYPGALTFALDGADPVPSASATLSLKDLDQQYAPYAFLASFSYAGDASKCNLFLKGAAQEHPSYSNRANIFYYVQGTTATLSVRCTAPVSGVKLYMDGIGIWRYRTGFNQVWTP